MQLYEPHTLSPSGHVLKQLRTGLNILMMQMDIPGTMLPGKSDSPVLGGRGNSWGGQSQFMRTYANPGHRLNHSPVSEQTHLEVCVCMPVQVRGHHRVSFSSVLHLSCFSSQSLSLTLDFTNGH